MAGVTGRVLTPGVLACITIHGLDGALVLAWDLIMRGTVTVINMYGVAAGLVHPGTDRPTGPGAGTVVITAADRFITGQSSGPMLPITVLPTGTGHSP